jgi:sodium/hydrogen antiporter
MVRQGLNVESGLNDGICVPLLVAALSFAEAEEALTAGGDVLFDLVTELAIAVGVGVVVGGVVAAAVRLSAGRGWLTPAWCQIVPLTAAIAAYAATQELGGSGFIAAFVGGLAFGKLLGADAHEDTELTEDLGDLLSAVTFVLFGAVLVEVDADTFSLRNIGFAVLALTVIRMGPVALSMIGSGARRPTVGFIGWFGPRGLATIVFALTVVEESGLSGTERIVDVAMITVLLSVFAHGLSASGLTSAYVGWVRSQASPLVMEAMEVAPGVHRRRGRRDQ